MLRASSGSDIQPISWTQFIYKIGQKDRCWCLVRYHVSSWLKTNNSKGNNVRSQHGTPNHTAKLHKFCKDELFLSKRLLAFFQPGLNHTKLHCVLHCIVGFGVAQQNFSPLQHQYSQSYQQRGVGEHISELCT